MISAPMPSRLLRRPTVRTASQRFGAGLTFRHTSTPSSSAVTIASTLPSPSRSPNAAPRCAARLLAKSGPAVGEASANLKRPRFASTRFVWRTFSRNSPVGSITSPPATNRSLRPSLLKSTIPLPQPARESVSAATPARAVSSTKLSLPWFWNTGIVSFESAVWKTSGLPSSSMSRASAPIPDSGRPDSG